MLYRTVSTLSYIMVNFFNLQYPVGAKIMEVKVRFFTNLREIVDKREETLSFADGVKVTVDLVLKTLSNKYGAPFTEYVYDAKRGSLRIFSSSSLTEQAPQHSTGWKLSLKTAMF